MSLLSVLAVAICAKPALSPWGVKGTAMLGGAVGQSQREAGCPSGDGAGRPRGERGVGTCWQWEEETRALCRESRRAIKD